jgi:hypothetical protein
MVVPIATVPADAHARFEPVSNRPEDWLGSTPLLDLQAPKLRLKARSLTQLCKNDREKALAIYEFVKSLPYTKRVKLHYPTAREVLQWHGGDGDDKATVLIALLRESGIPARIRYMEMRGEMLRGLIPDTAIMAARPLAEIWLGRWVRTDTYIFDAPYVNAARERLQRDGWERGWGIHINAPAMWDARNDAFLGAMPTEQDPMLLRPLCVVSDPLQLVAPDMRHKELRYRRSVRALQWNVLAPVMIRAIRQLRSGSRESA